MKERKECLEFRNVYIWFTEPIDVTSMIGIVPMAVPCKNCHEVIVRHRYEKNFLSAIQKVLFGHFLDSLFIFKRKDIHVISIFFKTNSHEPVAPEFVFFLVSCQTFSCNLKERKNFDLLINRNLKRIFPPVPLLCERG